MLLLFLVNYYQTKVKSLCTYHLEFIQTCLPVLNLLLTFVPLLFHFCGAASERAAAQMASARINLVPLDNDDDNISVSSRTPSFAGKFDSMHAHKSTSFVFTYHRRRRIKGGSCITDTNREKIRQNTTQVKKENTFLSGKKEKFLMIG